VPIRLALGHRPKYRAGRDPCGFQPRCNGFRRAGNRTRHDLDRGPYAFLIGFGAANPDPQARFAELEIPDVEGDQLRAAERAGKAKQEQRAIAKAFQVRPRRGRHRHHPVGRRWRLADLGGADGAANPADRRLHDLGVCGRLAGAGELMRIANRRDAPADA
jgi:hypothetical protein